MNKQHFQTTKQLKLTLLSSEKKLTQWRHRYVIEVVTDNKIEIVKRTFRDFQYFDKVVHDKINLTNRRLDLPKSHRTNEKYRNLQSYLDRLNSGLLLYDDQLPTTLLPHQTRELRGYLFTLLFEEDALFADGIDDSEQSDKQTKMRTNSLVTENQLKKAMTTKIEQKPVRRNAQLELEKKSKELKVDKQNPITKGLLNLVMRGGQNKKKKSIDLADTSSLKLILKKIDSCWIKIPNQFKSRDRNQVFHRYRWENYGLQLTEKTLILSKNGHRRIVVLYNSEIRIDFKEFTQIVITHAIDKYPLQIRLQLGQNPTETQQIYSKYLALYTQLKSIVQYNEMDQEGELQSLQKVKNKIKIRINIKKNQIVPSHPVEQTPLLNLKFIHNSINFNFNIPFQSSVQIDFPILDNYGAIELFFSEVCKNTGFLPHIKDPQSAALHIPVQGLYTLVYNKNKLKKKTHVGESKPTHNSSLQNTSHFKQKLVQLKHSRCLAVLEYQILGSQKAYCACQPQDIHESDVPPVQFSKDQLRMSTNRLKRIIWTVQQYSRWGKDLKNFTYPNLSYLLYGTLILVILLFDADYMLQYLFGSLIFTLMSKNPNCQIYATQIIDYLQYRQSWEKMKKFFYRKNQLLPTDFSKIQRKVSGGLFSIGSKNEKTVDDQLYQKQGHQQHEYVRVSREFQKQLFLRDFQLTRKVKRSIYKKYRRVQQMLLMGQYAIFVMVNIVEKIKNIFMWYHYEKTQFFLMLIVTAFMITSILPMRIVCLGVLLKVMRKGKKHHQRTQDINRVILIELIRALIEQNNYNYIRTYFKDHTRSLDFGNTETQSFFKKCRESLGDWLGISYDSALIQEKSPTMALFIRNLSKCKTKFKIKAEICQKYKFNIEWSKSQSSATRILKIVTGFILNVPSDKFIMGVKTIGAQESEEEDNEEILDLGF